MLQPGPWVVWGGPARYLRRAAAGDDAGDDLGALDGCGLGLLGGILGEGGGGGWGETAAAAPFGGMLTVN